MLMQTVRLVGSGVVVGLGLAWFGARAIRGFLFQVEPLDPLSLSGVAGVILLLSLVVALRPALRASRVDLAQVLRHD